MKEIISLVLVISFASWSYVRNGVWQDDGTLWMDTALKSPAKARGYNEIGLHAVGKQRYHEAIAAFMKSLELDLYQPVVYINLGIAYEGLKDWNKAKDMYERAISLNADDPTPYYNLGGLFYNVFKDREKALSLFLRARDLAPLEPDVHNYLGFIYRDMGMHDMSGQEFRLFRELK